jgi:hypothetical protein
MNQYLFRRQLIKDNTYLIYTLLNLSEYVYLIQKGIEVNKCIIQMQIQIQIWIKYYFIQVLINWC